MAAGLVENVRQALDPERGEWPGNAQLYQPGEDLLMLSEDSSCKAVEALLKFCGLDYEIQYRTNAEFMSPTGKLPFLKLGKNLVCDVEGIITEINSKGLLTSNHLEEDKKAEIKAFISLVKTTFYNAELHFMWMNKENANHLRKGYGTLFPWPLNYLVSYQKCWKAQNELKVINWHKKSTKEVCDEVITVCQALSEKLGEQSYFCGAEPTELDAVVFGHLRAILTRQLPDNSLATTILAFKSLVHYCNRIHSNYFERTTADSWIDVGAM